MSESVLMEIKKENILSVKSQYDMFRELQKEVLEENIDYGYPAGRRDQSQKPSLYKSGAEKLTRLFNLIPSFEILEQIERDDLIMYKFRCVLKTITGQIIGEGYGACNSREKHGWNSNPWAFQNNILKMAKKRSHVDAVLTGLGASNVFTQDLEDMEEHEQNHEQNQIQSQPITDKQIKMIHVLIKQVAQLADCSVDDVVQDIKDKWNVQSSKELTKEQASQVIEYLQKMSQTLSENNVIDQSNQASG